VKITGDKPEVKGKTMAEYNSYDEIMTSGW